ncbi:MAG: alpha/beta fold hydrolase [Xanthobacteraceae bacterium]|nr:alpha/beta fold hydrolase [Xanthobacteraceae bacterium]
MAARKRTMQPPLALETFGYLNAGGKIDHAVEGSPVTGQLYAEYFIPKKQTSPFPIVMVHGGSQTGTNFTGTPDGREGWAQYFLRRGHAVYVVDQVARGRAAHFSQSQGPVQAGNLKRTEQRFVAPKRFNLWPQARRHTQWPGGGRPGDAAFDAFYATQFPSLDSYPKQQELNRDALIALLEQIGPAVLLVHSQSGAFAWPVADARPKLVKAIVAIEPNGPPVYETDFTGAPDWFVDVGARKPFGLCVVPLAYEPPLKPGEQLSFVRQDKPDKPDLVRGWLQAEPARKLSNLAKVPILILVAEASYHAAYDHVTAAYLEQAGVPNDFVRLADIGIRGNGHMMMLEKNSDAIAGVIEQWMKKTLNAKRKAKRKPR